MSEKDLYKEWLGIPDGPRPPDHYTLLRLVMFEEDTEKIRSNYRKLNSHVRKFATGQYLKQSQDMLNELAKAMLCLTDPEARREYDASLGREVEKDIDEGEPVTLLEHLASQGDIQRSQIPEIEHFAEARGLSHRDAVVQMKLVDMATATKAMAAELRLAFLSLEDLLPEDDVLDRLPRSVVKRHTCLPLFEDGGRLLVACAHEPTPDLEDEIRLRYEMPMRPVLAVPRQISQAIARYYAPGTRDEAVAEQAAGSRESGQKAAAKKKKPPRPGGPRAPLSDEEKRNRRNLSIIAICWSVLIPMVLLSMTTELSGLVRTVVSLGTGALAAAVLRLTWWK